jgi:hypothetical protein
MASKKRKPWNADLVMPGLLDEPATVVKKSPDTVTVGHSTGVHGPLGKVGRFCPVCRVAIARGACGAHPDVELVAFLTQLADAVTDE